MPDAGLRVACISLESWDQVWRRNQHLASRLTGSGAASRLLFLEPPDLRRRRTSAYEPVPGVRVVSPRLLLPKRIGGLTELGRRLRRGVLRGADVLWINDPALGVHCLRADQRAVYDVTDDWRTFDFPPRIKRRIVVAEDALARRATTIVCSSELQSRWRERYGVEATIVHNGVDTTMWRNAKPRVYAGPGPHVGYVGTLQPERLDIDLVLSIADDNLIGTVHLIGPDALGDSTRQRLRQHPKVSLHPPVPAADVPSWTKGLDVVLSPHTVSPFTLSLDAIKSYEYLASQRPIVATPTSGFQFLADRNGVRITPTSTFVAELHAALSATSGPSAPVGVDWAARAEEFSMALQPIKGAST